MVYPVFMTKSCEQCLVIFVYSYKTPRNLRNAATQMIAHHRSNFFITFHYYYGILYSLIFICVTMYLH